MATVHGNPFQLHKAGRDTEETWFTRLDPRAKLLGILTFVITGAILTSTDLLLAALVLAAALAAASRVSAWNLAKAYIVALPFILLASVSLFIFTGPVQGANMVIRVSTCVLALLVLVNGTETFDLFLGLRRLKVPAVLTTLVMLTYRYVLLISEELDRMRIARKARGFSGGKSLLDRYGLRVLSYTAGMLLVRSSARADNIYEGLKMRGFREDMAAWRRRTMASADFAFLGLFLAASGALITIQLGVVP